MAVTTVTPTALTLNTASADLPDAGMTAIGTGSDGGSIDLSSYQGRPILIKVEDSTGGDFTFLAGDRPPAQLAGLGNLTVTMAANDVKYLVLEPARFLQDDQKILFTVGDDDGSCSVFVLPRNW